MAELDLEGLAGKFRPIPLDDLTPHDRWVAKAVADSRPPRPST